MKISNTLEKNKLLPSKLFLSWAMVWSRQVRSSDFCTLWANYLSLAALYIDQIAPKEARERESSSSMGLRAAWQLAALQAGNTDCSRLLVRVRCSIAVHCTNCWLKVSQLIKNHLRSPKSWSKYKKKFRKSRYKFQAAKALRNGI